MLCLPTTVAHRAAVLAFLLAAGCILCHHPQASPAAVTTAGDVQPADPTTWTASTPAYVGKTDTGTLALTEGSAVVTRDAYVAYSVDAGACTVNIDGAGSTWTCKSEFIVGLGGSGTLFITNGGKVSSGSTNCIGQQSGSTGEVTVDGAVSTWTNCGSLCVGSSGSGTLSITNGGGVASDNTGYTNYIGRQSGSTGEVTVDGADSTWTNNGSLCVGSSGSGTLSINDGGTVTSSSLNYIGERSGSTGEVTVDGPGSTWTITGLLYVGYSGNGTLNIAQGGFVRVVQDTYVDIYNKDRGAIRFDGGTLETGSLWADETKLSGTGTIVLHGIVADRDLVFDTPDDLTTQSFTYDSQPGQNITVRLNLDGQGPLGAGYTGTGSLVVRDGVEAVSTDGCIGRHPGSTGAVTIEGPGSTWTIHDRLQVGVSGDGTLNITHGALVRVAGGTSVDIYEENRGTIHFDGGTLDTGTLGADETRLTGAGTIILHGLIADRNLVFETPDDLTTQSFTYNSQPGQNITVRLSIDGQSSLGAGNTGIGSLTIRNGVNAASTLGYVGYHSGSKGDVTVDGTGSTWTTSKDLHVGCAGSGTLSITNGGLVSVAKTLTIDDYADGNSYINMASGGMLALKGNADHSLGAFLNLVSGTDAIRYWDDAVMDWALLAGATAGEDYSLGYLTEGDLAGYTVLTVWTPQPPPGDANGDGTVNAADAAILAANWLASSGVGWGQGDFNDDGAVDDLDLAILAANWQGGAGSPAVPEPGTIALVTAALLIVVAGRMRRRGR
ncbi:MAG: PEP-CTERM sorting domain-containing protein [Pirellulales bacterium]|nr:PEP-CTERM sorting domain-containing protein [Pirellulales bacterium]